MSITEATEALRRGEMVVFPTRGPYGIAAAADLDDAVASVFQLKERPHDVPLPVGVASMEQMESLVRVTDLARSLLEHFHPSDLTLVLEPRDDAALAELLRSTGGLGVRILGHPIGRELAESAGPYTVTSANLHGQPSATTVDQARAQLGDRISVYLDGGVGEGLPSTVVDARARELMVIREGRIPRQLIHRKLEQ